jgi:hypothetical protein
LPCKNKGAANRARRGSGNLSRVKTAARLLRALRPPTAVLSLLATFALAAPALAQKAADGEVLVRVETPLGIIDIAVDTRRAPITITRMSRIHQEHP